MSLLSISDLQARIEDRIASSLQEKDWKKSRFPFPLFGADTQQLSHIAFAVGLPSSTWPSGVESSITRRGAAGGLVTTSVRVRWSHRCRADVQLLDFAAAQDAEIDLVVAVLGMSLANCHIRVTEAQRDMDDSGTWVLGEVGFAVQHQYQLTP